MTKIIHSRSLIAGLSFGSLLLLLGCASAPQGGTGEQPNSSSSGSLLPWQSSGVKIGYIRSDVIQEKYPEYRDADVALKNENRKWLEEVDELEENIRKIESELDDLALILSDERKAELAEEVTNSRKELQKFRQKTWYDEKSEYVKRRKELMEPIDARVNDAIWRVCDQKSLDIVFDTVAGNVVYVKPGFDITEDVLEELQH